MIVVAKNTSCWNYKMERKSFITTRKKYILATILGLAMIAGSTYHVYAGLAGGVFGGRMYNTWICSCNFGSAITFGRPKSGTYLYQAGTSKLFKEYRLWPGPWALGTYTRGSICLYYVGKSCSTYKTSGTIRLMGTGAY